MNSFIRINNVLLFLWRYNILCKTATTKTMRWFFPLLHMVFLFSHTSKPFYIEFRVGRRSNKCEAWVDVSSSEVSMFFASTNVAPGTRRLNFQLRCCTNGACRSDSVCYSTSESCSRNERDRIRQKYTATYPLHRFLKAICKLSLKVQILMDVHLTVWRLKSLAAHGTMCKI